MYYVGMVIPSYQAYLTDDLSSLQTNWLCFLTSLLPACLLTFLDCFQFHWTYLHCHYMLIVVNFHLFHPLALLVLSIQQLFMMLVLRVCCFHLYGIFWPHEIDRFVYFLLISFPNVLAVCIETFCLYWLCTTVAQEFCLTYFTLSVTALNLALLFFSFRSPTECSKSPWFGKCLGKLIEASSSSV